MAGKFKPETKAKPTSKRPAGMATRPDPKAEGSVSLPSMEELLALQGNHAIDLGGFDRLGEQVSSMETPFARELAERQLALELARVSQGSPETLYKLNRGSRRRRRSGATGDPMAQMVAEAVGAAEAKRNYTEVRMPPKGVDSVPEDLAGGGYVSGGDMRDDRSYVMGLPNPAGSMRALGGPNGTRGGMGLMEKVGMGVGALGGVGLLAQLMGQSGSSPQQMDLGGVGGEPIGDDGLMEMRHMLADQQAMTPTRRFRVGDPELDAVVDGEAERLAQASIPMRKSLAQAMAELGHY
jgi:hypothetical protein